MIRCKAARHPFSLLEVMIVIVLMGAIASVSAFSLWPFYQSYRFKLEVEALYELLQELQLEAMTLQSDMKVGFTKGINGWMAKSFTDEPALKSHTIDLFHIDQINENEIILYSNGLIENPRMIKFSYKEEHRWIDFSGGHLIKLCETAPQPIIYEKLNLAQIKHSLEKDEAQKPGL